MLAKLGAALNQRGGTAEKLFTQIGLVNLKKKIENREAGVGADGKFSLLDSSLHDKSLRSPAAFFTTSVGTMNSEVTSPRRVEHSASS